MRRRLPGPVVSLHGTFSPVNHGPNARGGGLYLRWRSPTATEELRALPRHDQGQQRQGGEPRTGPQEVPDTTRGMHARASDDAYRSEPG